MSELMKKHPTEGYFEIRIRGPVKKREAVLRAIRQIGFETVGDNDALPWRSVLSEPTPGEALKGARTKEGLTQRALAELTGIPQRHISEMENGKRPIGKNTARSLSETLKVDRRLFL